MRVIVFIPDVRIILLPCPRVTYYYVRHFCKMSLMVGIRRCTLLSLMYSCLRLFEEYSTISQMSLTVVTSDCADTLLQIRGHPLTDPRTPFDDSEDTL